MRRTERVFVVGVGRTGTGAFLRMEETDSSETLVQVYVYQATQHHVLDDPGVNICHRENMEVVLSSFQTHLSVFSRVFLFCLVFSYVSRGLAMDWYMFDGVVTSVEGIQYCTCFMQL